MNELIIDRVKTYPCLYNPAHCDYRNQCIRQRAWETIGKELEVPIFTVRTLWDKLRRCYSNVRRRRRLEKAKSGKPSKNSHLWKYERRMSFLAPIMEKKKTVDCLKDSPASDTLEDDTLADEVLETQSDNQSEESETEESAPTQSEGEQLHRVVEFLNENSVLIKGEYEQENRRSESHLENLDELDLFFLSMSRMAKQLPKFEQIQIKIALSNSVLSAEQRCYEHSASSTADHNY